MYLLCIELPQNIIHTIKQSGNKINRCRKNKTEVINYTSSSDVISGLSKEEVIKTTYEEFYKAMLV
jgi:hypothetical protein